ncbi:MAG: hypothetical protein K9H61_06825 [Bacteroidia bacterium]|nr:hypothetical protein [Bacteroidia bacterium]MCF8427833.1 hypothetical protein [Bacteroidia bacterium]MCF8446692.1 hypothetical protein [Bacteroidia bacterium]
MQYIIDACTLINLLHIDEDEFLLKKLQKLEFVLCKVVYDEINKNVFKKLQKTIPYPIEMHKDIEIKLNYLRERIYSDESYKDLDEALSKLLNYSKKNGEYQSMMLSFYLNTFNKTRVLFFTDDSPAKKEFAPYLEYHKIGYIEDSVDLLITLYRHNDGFTTGDLKRFLSLLYHEYACEISALEKVLQNFEIPRNEIRNRELIIMLGSLKQSINKLELGKVASLYSQVTENKKKYSPLFDMLIQFSDFFRSEISSDFLAKINQNIEFADSKPFYKF